MPDGFMAGDVNGDGADDLIYTLVDLNDDEPEKLVVRAGSKDGSGFGSPRVTEFPVDTGLGIRPADVDADGKAELMVSVTQEGTRRWSLYESDGLDYEPAPGGGGLEDDGLDASLPSRGPERRRPTGLRGSRRTFPARRSGTA